MEEKRGFNKWANSKLKGLNWMDIAFTKIAVFAFALLIAKVWMPILNLDWYWYLAIFLIFAIKSVFKTLRK